MKLLTKAIEAKIPKIGSQGENPKVYVKFFDPGGRYTYYATEYDPEERLLYGFCVSPLGAACSEWGYTSLDELAGVRNRFGIGIERDLYFDTHNRGVRIETALAEDHWDEELERYFTK